MTHQLAQYTFTDEEWRQLEEQRKSLDERMAAEHGEDWVKDHRKMLDAQWEAVVSMGLFTLE